MAEAAETEKTKSGGTGLMGLVLAIVLGVVVSVVALGAAGFWLVKSGRLPLGAPGKVEAAEKKEPVKAKMVTLDPLLVNLADEGGHAYLRVSIVLREEVPPPVKGEKKDAEEEKAEKGKPVVNESDVVLRDAALNAIGHDTAEMLLAADGKEKLKADLERAMQEKMPEPKVKILDVLFTEFLVQR